MTASNALRKSRYWRDRSPFSVKNILLQLLSKKVNLLPKTHPPKEIIKSLLVNILFLLLNVSEVIQELARELCSKLINSLLVFFDV